MKSRLSKIFQLLEEKAVPYRPEKRLGSVWVYDIEQRTKDAWAVLRGRAFVMYREKENQNDR